MFVDEKKGQSLIVSLLSLWLSLWFASTSSTKEILLSSVIQYALADTVREWQRESFLKKNFPKEVASRGAHDKQHMWSRAAKARAGKNGDFCQRKQ